MSSDSAMLFLNLGREGLVSKRPYQAGQEGQDRPGALGDEPGDGNFG